MKRVTGIGGIFFKSPNPKALNDWYRDHLGLEVSEWGGAVFEWGGPDSAPGMTLWTPFAEDTSKMEPSTSSFMVNFRVADLEALLSSLRNEGCNVVGDADISEYGKFGWVLDPDGNKVELWEPPATQFEGRLLDKSIEAYILALETINRLSIKYRIETFSYLICNAWELLLKAKIIKDTKNPDAIFYREKQNEPRRSIALRDCLRKIFQDENDPTRRNLERVVELRDEAVHLVISQVPKSVLSLFQSCVLNYHKRLVDWFGISLSGRVSVGMMTIVYDFSPEQFDLTSPILRRQLGKETIEYLANFQAGVLQDFENLNKPTEFSIDINYKLALVQKTGDADIVLTKGESGLTTSIVEVPKDPSKTHPHRQKEVIEQINTMLNSATRIRPHDIQCVVNVYGIKKRPEFYYKGAVKGSPVQYSHDFVIWLMKEYEKDNEFFKKVQQQNAKLRERAVSPT